MMRNIFLLLLILFVVACTADDGTEPKLFPLDLNGISKITITTVGVKSIADKDSNISCKGFVLTQNNVDDYFKKTKRVTGSDYRQMLDWSPCFVKGKIFLDNGKVGEWGIHQYKAGTINFGTDKTIYMFCPKCKAKLFDSPVYMSNQENDLAK